MPSLARKLDNFNKINLTDLPIESRIQVFEMIWESLEHHLTRYLKPVEIGGSEPEALLEYTVQCAKTELALDIVEDVLEIIEGVIQDEFNITIMPIKK